MLHLKIQKQISSTCQSPVLTNNRKHEFIASQSKIREENCIGTYCRGLRSPNGKHFVSDVVIETRKCLIEEIIFHLKRILKLKR